MKKQDSNTSNNDSPTCPLFRKHPILKDKIPYLKIMTCSETPVEKLLKVSTKLHSDIYIKRDDLTNTEDYGGNKVRKYEFVIADMLKKGKKVVLLPAAFGSNHALAFTMFAKKYNIKTNLYLVDQKVSKSSLEIAKCNLLCDYFFGANIVYSRTVLRTILWILKDLVINLRSFYILEPGASDVYGVLGYINGALELAEQIENKSVPKMDRIYVTVGSMGMIVGIYIGMYISGLKNKPKIIGVAVIDDDFCSCKKMLKLCKKTMKFLQKYIDVDNSVYEKMSERVTCIRDFWGSDYGVATIEGLEAIKMAKMDNVKLDPVYTGKCFSALVHYCKMRNIRHLGKKKENILFWNSKNPICMEECAKKVDYKKLPRGLHKLFDGRMEVCKPVRRYYKGNKEEEVDEIVLVGVAVFVGVVFVVCFPKVIEIVSSIKDFMNL